MGIASAMNTALTGLTAAETQLDVAGNNLANSQTVGFKASEAVFATQFLRTLSLGSAPTNNNGGTNPRQVGLGVQVAEITPDFGQGTIEISSTPSHLAIQGDGFFIVEGPQGERMYTRNGIFKTNSQSELVTATGDRVLGFGVDEFFNIQSNQLVALTIPLGSAAVAQATQNVFLDGNLAPNGDVGTTAGVIESAILGDALVPRPEVNDPADPTLVNTAPTPTSSGTTSSTPPGATTFLVGEQYEYVFTFLDDSGQESLNSAIPISVTIDASGDTVQFSNLPASPINSLGNPEYDNLNIYRRQLGVPATNPASSYRLIGSAAEGAASFVDSANPGGTVLDSGSLSGTYSYLITFSGPSATESRPSELLGPINVVDGRIHLDNLPNIPTGPGIPAYDTINIYRNLSSNSSDYFLVTSVAPNIDYTDHRTDAQISDLTNPANRKIDLDGPKINTATLLTNVLKRNGLEYEQLFEVGELTFKGRKGPGTGRALDEKVFQIEADTTVGELTQFMSAAMGIQVSSPGDPNPIPGSENNIDSSGTLTPGGTVTSAGRIRLVGNNGIESTVRIDSSAFSFTNSSGDTSNPVLAFGSVQDAVGESTSTDLVVYDSLGIPLDLRLTAVLESIDDTTSTFRWFAESGDNDPLGDNHAIAVGTGLVSFDGEGNMISSTNNTVNIERRDIPSSDPLSFILDFSQVSGFASDGSEWSASRQDGSPVGTLTSFTVGEDGVIRGVFNNGVARELGQIRMARFSNPSGLEQRGRNMFGSGINSGLPVEGNPGDLGLGNVVAGALELSNTDVGENLIDLILATTQYRSNSRVISTAQQLLDELLNLRR